MRRLTFLALPVVAALATGCVQMHSAIVIEPDGSGTFSLDYSMSQEVAAAMAEMGDDGGMGGDQTPSLDDFDRDAMERHAAKNGVTIASFERKTAEGRETFAMKLKFRDVAGLSRTLNGANDADEEPTIMTILRDADGNYVLTSIPDPNPPAPEPAQEEPAEETPAGDPAKAMEAMGKLMSKMSELDVRMEVTVPGDVISSNAPLVEGRTSIWAVNSANMMNAQGSAMEPEITFAKQGVTIDAPTRQE